jgi:hypothetical protein
VQSRAGSGIHKRVQTEQIDFALQKGIESRLSETKAGGSAGLGQSALLNKLLDVNHDF